MNILSSTIGNCRLTRYSKNWTRTKVVQFYSFQPIELTDGRWRNYKRSKKKKAQYSNDTVTSAGEYEREKCCNCCFKPLSGFLHLSSYAKVSPENTVLRLRVVLNLRKTHRESAFESVVPANDKLRSLQPCVAKSLEGEFIFHVFVLRNSFYRWKDISLAEW